jgi:hypothetical protein
MRLKEAGRRFLGAGREEPPKKPERMKNDRRAGNRIALRLPIRVKVGDHDACEARVLDVNLPGLAFEPAVKTRSGEPLTIGFDGYPDVSPPFALVARVRRTLADDVNGEATGLGVEIDRDLTSADALQNYKRLVRHYLHHRPLLDENAPGLVECKCESCAWTGKVSRRHPVCARCGQSALAVVRG